MLSGITSVVGINIEKSLRYDYMLAATHMHELCRRSGIEPEGSWPSGASPCLAVAL